MNKLILFIFLLFVFIASSNCSLQCLDEKGNEVEWFAIFVYPFNTAKYAYADANNPTLVQSDNTLTNGQNTAESYSLGQLYGTTLNGVSQSYIMFNDEEPPISDSEAPYVESGHAKGVIAVNDDGEGFWFQHSIPKFPLSPKFTNYFQYQLYGETLYGQSIFCVSFNSKEAFNDLGSQLQYFKPLIYDTNVTSSLKSFAPNLYDAANGKYVEEAKYSTIEVKTSKGTPITSFAKTGYLGRGWDMYTMQIAPYYKDDLKVETWRQGSGDPLPSNCTYTYDVYNIDDVEFFSTKWNYLNDHSKYAITTSSSNVCFCGINRMASQGERGGGGLCINHQTLYTSVSAKIIDFENCGSNFKKK